jgi:hypothetical protein
MRFLPVLLTLTSLLMLADRVSASMVFNLKFDTTFDQSLAPPILPPSQGTGLISFDDDLADGTYLISTLTNFYFSATIAGETWTMADLVSDPTPLGVTIFTKYGGRRDIFFDGPAQEPLGGSANFVNSNNQYFATEPNDLSLPFVVPHDRWIVGTYSPHSSSGGGNYGVHPVPEPGTWMIYIVYLLGGFGWLRRFATIG